MIHGADTTQQNSVNSLNYVLLMIFLAILGTVGVIYYNNSHLKEIEEPLFSYTEPTRIDQPSTLTNEPTSVTKYSHDYTIPAVKNGLAPVLSKIPTKQNVVFLGIDDGANKKDEELKLLEGNQVYASLYLARRFITDNPQFFKPFEYGGSVIEDHSLTHRLLSGVSYAEQKQEICGMADYIRTTYGHSPTFFRPPGGSYDENTQKATADCGMKAVVLWHAKANGGSMQYQNGHGLVAGDIVLMHFRPEFAKDLQAFLDAQKAAGLHTELLEDWL